MKDIHNTNTVPPLGLSSTVDDLSAISAFKEGLAHEVEDFVSIELTAEQMLHDETHLVLDYVANDAKNFWADLSGELSFLELAAGKMLLSAADPTSLEWQLSQWWSNKSAVHH